MTMKKTFKLRPEEIRADVAPNRGGCYATDVITVKGERVGFMYREPPDNQWDSGWRFFGGREPQAYLDDPANTAIYDVNTIANYDPEIVPLLDSPAGSAFERAAGTGRFVATKGPALDLEER